MARTLLSLKAHFKSLKYYTTKKTRTLQLQRTSWSGLDLQIAFRESSKLLPPRRSYSDSTHCWHDKFNFEIYFYAGVARRDCMYVKLWQYGSWSFQTGGTKSERFLPDTQRNYLISRIGFMGSCQILGIIWENKMIKKLML